MRKYLAIGAVVLCGILALADFFIRDPVIDRWGAVLAEGALILGAFALILGVLNLLSTHVRRALRGTQDKGLSVVLVVGLLVTLAIGVGSPASEGFDWLFDYMYVPLQATLGALLAFFAVSAVYRTFRMQNLEAILLLTTSLLVIIVQLPFIGTLSPYLVRLRTWLMAVPVTAGVRGILLGVALGTLSTSARVLLSVDRPYMSD